MNIRPYIIIFLAFWALTVHAQTADEHLRAIYDQAEQDYNIGRLEQAEQQLQQNLKNFPVTLLPSAYRMLALCYLGMDREEDAHFYVQRLLEDNPYYSPTLNDPQRFIDMVDNLKSGLSATITTASSQAEKLSEAPVPTTLISEEMIRNSGARNLQELLAIYVPGMNIVDCNDDINISMRGVYSNGQEKILFLLNGHRINSYCTNIAAPDFSMSLEKLKQIEVLRGPASSLYGGVALTAVVNLITKQGADVDGLKLRTGLGNYGQYHGDAVFGKRYFDLDILLWGSFYAVKGQKSFISKENTGLGSSYGHDGDVTIGGIGPKPSYDIGTSIKYKNLQLLYNIHFSQVQSPMTMTVLFSPYDIEKYKTYYGTRPSFTTMSHHADLSYSHQLGDVYLKGSVTYDNSDMAHYQVISDVEIPALVNMIPVPEASKALVAEHPVGLSRYITGQEHTFGGKIQGDWSYINKGKHKGLLTFGAEYSYFQLDDTRYVFGYNFRSSLPETIPVSDLGKGHEHNANTYLQLKHNWGPFILNAGLRFDYKYRYDSTHIREFSPRVALLYVKPKWNVKLSYSKSYIDAPFLYRKSNLFLAAFAGMGSATEMLNPESLISYQMTFGATQWIKGLDFEVNAFYNRASDLIQMDLLQHNNGGKSDIYGIELSGKYESKRFKSYLTASWQKARKYKYLLIDMPMLNTPEFSTNIVLAYKPIKNLTLHSRVGFYSRQHTVYIDIINYARKLIVSTKIGEFIQKYGDVEHIPAAVLPQYEKLVSEFTNMAEHTYNHRDIDPYVLVDLGANYTIGKLQLSLNVNNVLNNHYSLSGANTGLIPQKGRWFMFDIAYKF